MITLKEQTDFRNEQSGDLKHYDCELCKNKGVIYFVNEEEIKVKTCNCMIKRKINKNLLNDDLSEDFKRYRLDNFLTDKPHWKVMYDKAIKFLDKPSGAFYVGGQSGSGKTHLCTAISKELIERGYDFKYLNYARDFIRIQMDLKNFKIDVNEKAQDTLKEIATVKVLYIDDFLKVGGYDNVFELINSRYNKNLITIISSENYLEEIKDEAVYGRIYEMSGNSVVKIARNTEKNYRIKS